MKKETYTKVPEEVGRIICAATGEVKMMRQSKRVKLKKDRTPHTIDEKGRTCTGCEEYKVWKDYRPSKSWTGFTSRCTECTNIAAGTRRRNVKKTPEQIKEAFFTPMNMWLMKRWA